MPVTIPPFYCPIPPRLRPDAEEIDRASFSWFAALNACDDDELGYLDRSRCGLVSAWGMPDAAAGRVRIAADIMYLAEALDDTAFETGRLGRSPEEAMAFLTQLARVVEAPETPLLLGNPWAEGVRDMRRRVGGFTTPLQLQRWICGWQRLFFGLAWEASVRARELSPGLDEYVMIRVLGHTIGMEILTTLNDAADGYELTHAELNGLPVRALTEMNWMLISFDNDLYSYHQESARHPNGLNFVDVIARDLRCTPAEAVPHVVAMRDRVMSLFLALRAKTAATASENLKRYLESLGQWLRANIDWGTTSERYLKPFGPDSPPETWAALPTVYADGPSDAALEPIPVPVVSWWWGLL
ncbi:hypothetical protein NLX83_39915 [Allokutzneria sp. A3M-2-11 16]|uniref:terpene synthase family protein n=1 Tax=Allokutzneria sp. A3M-2-11 16 TaxID=2962043 RepID=UPI0020B8F4CA|nr:hypothetical protein [Allokutzneria sp. A3M-2-11 16]MCP3805450.1 hypothetical protein [Allokutzneria sp. A3M-2-11 16]